VLTSLGVRNVSFGSDATGPGRAQQRLPLPLCPAGLDAAIINPAQTVPYAEISEERRQLAEDLIFNRGRMRSPLHRPLLGVTERVGAEKVDPFAGLAAPERPPRPDPPPPQGGIEALSTRRSVTGARSACSTRSSSRP